MVSDKSNGYETIATRHIAVRSPTIGATSVRDWSRALSRVRDCGLTVEGELSDEGDNYYYLTRRNDVDVDQHLHIAEPHL